MSSTFTPVFLREQPRCLMPPGGQSRNHHPWHQTSWLLSQEDGSEGRRHHRGGSQGTTPHGIRHLGCSLKKTGVKVEDITGGAVKEPPPMASDILAALSRRRE